MKNKKLHIYFVPGLAANPKIFDFLYLPKESFELHYLEWLIPESRDESIQTYAKRMSANVKHDKVVLIGVSFGGVMVQEMKSILNPQKTIIISSIKNKFEMPSRMRFAKKTNLHKLFPLKAFSNIEKYDKYIFGSLLKRRVVLYKKYLSMRDEVYLPWSINAIVNWQRELIDPEIIHIHGTSDHIFPIKNIKDAIHIEGGTHIMIIVIGKKISTILQDMI